MHLEVTMRVSSRVFSVLVTALVLLTTANAQVPSQGRALHINHAVYGKEGKGKDVTGRIRATAQLWKGASYGADPMWSIE